MWDLIVIGGGSSGVAAAVAAAKCKCKTLLIEKNGFLGGTSTASLVTPMMKNITDHNLTDGLYSEVLDRLAKTEDSAVFSDDNPGWFNPEMMKCILDDICQETGVELLFDTVLTGATTHENIITSVRCYNKSGFNSFEAKYFIDASGDADLAAYAGVPFESGENGNHQAMTLRFVMGNVNLGTFGVWLNEIDPDSGVSVVDFTGGKILLSTAYTWDNKGWKLKPYFDQAVKDGVLLPEDTAYFQVFAIPGQIDALGFNCPRIYSERTLDPLNQWDLSYAEVMGRKQIRRLADFCRKYLPGFKEAYISQIAPQLGIRDSRRIEGVYKLTEEDIMNARKFENAVVRSNYPVDIHSKEKNKSELKFLPEGEYYEIPLESLLPKNINNLVVAGRCISATFKAQASLRIQPNCWSMGEAAGKYISKQLHGEN